MINYYQSTNSGLPFDPYGSTPGFNMANNQNYMPQQPTVYQQQPQPPRVDPRMFETPKIASSGKSMFTVVKSNDAPTNGPGTIKVDTETDMEIETKKRAARTAGKKEVVASNNGEIVKVGTKDGNTDIEDQATINSYAQTSGLLHETLGQIDAINAELVKEFEMVKNNRTMKNKYMVLTNLSENIGSLINNRISTIKEINNCISKSNELDYRKYKDIKAAQSAMSDDKYIADLYQAFMQNPMNKPTNIQMSNPVDPAVYGSGIIRATVSNDQVNSGGPIDTGYLSYLSNLTPEQNLMRYEGDPNVKQVVVYDASTGAKFFQIMNMATGEVIPNVPVYDQMFMEDTTLDLNTKIAKNLNMNETFPIVVINDNITSQY